MPTVNRSGRPTRSDGEDCRRALVDAARSIAATDGFSRVTMRQVANAAGVSPGLAFHYFATRDELVAESFETAANDDLSAMRAVIAQHDDPLRQLWALLHVYAPLTPTNRRSYLMWLDAWAEAVRSPSMRAATQRVTANWEQMVTDIVAAGCRSGVFHHAEPKHAAWRITAAIDGLAIQAALNDSFPRSQLITWARQSCVEMLHLPAEALTMDVPIRRNRGHRRTSSRLTI
ncbi:MAG: TetR family transcriptional regulator [Actinobacteria bacterium]|jgi:AcrR family transcriptional regulator|uniref:Unannotated protein n=1 Tax=freshwater metagenome TaxID=449393 RepID=A0A6J6E7G2_9ZZZZ|nr:TetR family transcriptional regulator [Actinomycetota bacterium]